MWIISTIGFFSIVQKEKDRVDGTLTIRARVREDLERLKAQYLPDMTEIQESPVADYRFRSRAPRGSIAAALPRLVSAIDYDNFKDAVAHRQGRSRANAYSRVWSELYELQQTPEAG